MKSDFISIMLARQMLLLLRDIQLVLQFLILHQVVESAKEGFCGMPSKL